MKKIIFALLPVAAVLMSCAAPIGNLDPANAKNAISAIEEAQAAESYVVPTQMTFEQTTYAEESLNGEKEAEEVYTLMSMDAENGYFHAKTIGGETWGYVSGTDYYLVANTEGTKQYAKQSFANAEEAKNFGLVMMGNFGLGVNAIESIARQPEMLRELKLIVDAYADKENSTYFKGYENVELKGSANGTSIEATITANANASSEGMNASATFVQTIKFENARFVKAYSNVNQTVTSEGMTMSMVSTTDINVSYTCDLAQPSLDGYVEVPMQ